MSTECEYFKIDNKVNTDGQIIIVPNCTYSEEYHQKTTCEGNRRNCAYPEKWGEGQY